MNLEKRRGSFLPTYSGVCVGWSREPQRKGTWKVRRVATEAWMRMPARCWEDGQMSSAPQKGPLQERAQYSPWWLQNACLFGFPVKMTRPEEKGKHRAAWTASLLTSGWPGKAPKATCLPFQRSALPWAAWAQVTAHPQLPEVRPTPRHTLTARQVGRPRRPECRRCWPRSQGDNP